MREQRKVEEDQKIILEVVPKDMSIKELTDSMTLGLSHVVACFGICENLIISKIYCNRCNQNISATSILKWL